MFICENCGRTFEMPVLGSEEEKDSCPCCGDWGIREAKKCKVCGEWTAYDICEACENEFEKAVNDFVDIYAKTLKLPRDTISDMMMEALDKGLTVTVTAERIGAI